MSASKRSRVGKYIGLLPGATSEASCRRIHMRIVMRGWDLQRTIEEAIRLHPAIAERAFEGLDYMAESVTETLYEHALRDKGILEARQKCRNAARLREPGFVLHAIAVALGPILTALRERTGEALPRGPAQELAGTLRSLADVVDLASAPLPANVVSLAARRRRRD